MSRTGEFAAFAGLALLLHIGAWLGMARPGSEAAGSGGEAVISLMAATGEVADLIDAWTQPVEAQRIAPTLPRPDQSSASPLSPPPVFLTEVAPFQPSARAVSIPVLPQVPETRPWVDMSTVRPAVIMAAPDTSLRPSARPAQPTSANNSTSAEAEPKTISRQPESQLQPSGAQAQTAAGNQVGENAGDSFSQRPATLSSAARQSLLAQWGVSIRNRIERRKRYPRGSRASGTTVLRITISRSGNLVAVSVAKPSGARELDQAAIEAVRRARYPSAPMGLDADQYHFNLPLVFTKS